MKGVVLVALAVAAVVVTFDNRATDEEATVRVFTAKQMIPAGSEIVSRHVYSEVTMLRSEVEVDALTNLEELAGLTTAVDIFPGQQFTTRRLGGLHAAA